MPSCQNKNSSLLPNTQNKPVNIFYVWYSELCRRLNSSPAPVVKPAKPKCQTVLDFVADRLKVEEWSPVISALRHDTSLHVIAIKSRLGNCQFLHEVDTEEKVRTMKRRTGSLWTAFILKSLLKSLSCTIRNNQVLSCLEFDGLPMFAQYLEPLMKALQKNKTIKTFTLSRCAISDAGCQMVCAYIRFVPNIEVLNLSECGLTGESGDHIAKLIKYQQINRYCESWHNSLRYADPNIQLMRGIKRITLNRNPCFGDHGLECILNELEDDLWIKALDVQKCGITEKLSARIVNVVEYSQSLEILDLRLNEELSITTLERVFAVLKQKHLNFQTEYQWCKSTYTLTCESGLETASSIATIKNQSVHKAKSAPLRRIQSKTSVDKVVRRTKTCEDVKTKPNGQMQEVQKKVQELNCLLQDEITKRREIEKVNQELKRKLEEINSKESVVAEETKKKANVEEKYEDYDEDPMTMISKICTSSNKNGYKTNGVKNGVKFSINGDASTILESLIGNKEASCISDDENNTLLDYVEDHPKTNGDGEKLANGYDMSDSQVSLIKFMENLKNHPVNNMPPVKSRPHTAKYYVNNKNLNK